MKQNGRGTKYIHEFIPLKEKLDELGYLFDIKGRTKSIHSIYNKIKKQNTPFEKFTIFCYSNYFDVLLRKEKAAVGKLTLLLLTCTNLIQNLCATGFRYQNQMVMKVYTLRF